MDKQSNHKSKKHNNLQPKALTIHCSFHIHSSTDTRWLASLHFFHTRTVGRQSSNPKLRCPFYRSYNFIEPHLGEITLRSDHSRYSVYRYHPKLPFLLVSIHWFWAFHACAHLERFLHLGRNDTERCGGNNTESD